MLMWATQQMLPGLQNALRTSITGACLRFSFSIHLQELDVVAEIDAHQ